MQHNNPDKKSLKELINEAEENKMKIVVLSDSIEESPRAETFLKHERFMVIQIHDLLEDDRKDILDKMAKAEDSKINRDTSMDRLIDNIMKDSLKAVENLTNEMAHMEDIVLEEKENAKRHALPKQVKPYKGFTKDHKTQFKGRRKH